MANLSQQAQDLLPHLLPYIKPGQTIVNNYNTYVTGGGGGGGTGGMVPQSLTISATAPLRIDGIGIADLSAPRTLSINLAADGGLETNAANLRVKMPANSGITRDATGIYLAPSTLTTTTVNAVSGAGHTHLLDSASNPGAAAKILQTDGAGHVTLVKVWTPNIGTVSGAITINAVTDVVLAPTEEIRLNAGTYTELPNSKVIRTASYASGFAGNGLRIDQGIGEPGKTTIEVDNLWVRGRLHVYELLIHQIRATNGAIWVSSVGKVSAVSGSGPYAITTDPNHGFLVGDLIMAQRWNGGVYQSKMQVTAVADLNNFTATLTSGDPPQVGFDYVRIGSVSDANRRGSIYLTADDSGAPFLDVIDGINSHAAFQTAGTIKVRLGNLQGYYGYGSRVYGFASGVSGGVAVTVDDGNGFRILDNTTARFQVTASGDMHFKNSAGANTISLLNDGTSFFAGVMTIGTSGEIRQGTGTIGSNYTGLRIWRDGNFGRIAGYNSNTIQWSAETDGKLKAGGGNVVLENSGITVSGSASADATWVRFLQGAAWRGSLHAFENTAWAETGHDWPGIAMSVTSHTGAQLGGFATYVDRTISGPSYGDVRSIAIADWFSVIAKGALNTYTPRLSMSAGAGLAQIITDQASLTLHAANAVRMMVNTLRVTATGVIINGGGAAPSADLHVVGDLLVTGDIIADSITGDVALGGQIWQYDTGNMYIRTNSGGVRTLYVQNMGAGTFDLNVAGDIVVSGYVDGIDVSGFYSAYTTHISQANAHHNRQHDLDDASDHTGTLSWAKVNKTGSSLADLATRAHSSLTGIGANDHHNQQHDIDGADHTGVLSWTKVNKTGSNITDLATRAHSGLTGIGANDHHNQQHSLTGGDHTASGLTTGHYLRATGSSTFAFAAVLDADLPSTIVRTSRQIIAGLGLTGTSTLASDVTLNVGAGSMISVAADTVGLTPAGNNYYMIRSDGAGASEWQAIATLAGAGMTATNGVLNVIAGTLISVAADSVSLANAGGNYQFVTSQGSATPVWTNIATLAGGGMTATNGVLNVIAGTLVTVAADSVSLANAGGNYQFVTSQGSVTPVWTDISTLAGGGMTATNGVLNVIAGTLVTVAADSVSLANAGGNYQFVTSQGTVTPVWTNISVLAGAGMTATDGVLNVIAANASITVGADNLNVNLAHNFAWSGTHQFAGTVQIQQTLTARHIFPEATDTYDLGSSTMLWRQSFISQMNAVLYAENTAQLIGGWFIIPKYAGTTGPVSAVATTVDLGVASGGIISTGDFILIRAHDASGTIKAEYMTVGSFVSGTTWNVTRDVAAAHGTDPVWPDGTPYMLLGKTGDGRIELNAQDTPRISMVAQGATYNAQVEYLRMGDLNANWGYGSQTWGFATGRYGVASHTWVTVDPTNGFRVGLNTAVIGQWDVNGKITLGEVANSTPRIEMDSTNGVRLLFKDGGGTDVPKITLNPSGNAFLSGRFNISTTGDIWQGSGTPGSTSAAIASWGSSYTGTRIGNIGGVGILAGYNNSVAQWWVGTDGKFYGGAGDVALDADGIKLKEQTSGGYFARNSLRFMLSDMTTTASEITGEFGSDWQALYIQSNHTLNAPTTPVSAVAQSRVYIRALHQESASLDAQVVLQAGSSNGDSATLRVNDSSSGGNGVSVAGAGVGFYPTVIGSQPYALFSSTRAWFLNQVEILGGSGSLGSAADPALTLHITSFGTLSGLFLPNGTSLAVSVNGAESARFVADGLRTVNGSVSAPAWSFTADDDTGVYRVGADKVGIAAGGTLTLAIGTLGIENLVGTASNPSYTFAGDGDTGMLHPAANTVALSAGGNQILTVNTTGIQVALSGTDRLVVNTSGITVTGVISNGKMTNLINLTNNTDHPLGTQATFVVVTAVAGSTGIAGVFFCRASAVTMMTGGGITTDGTGNYSVYHNGTQYVFRNMSGGTVSLGIWQFARQ